MTISSRTPEGFPSKCPLCGAKANIEFSDPGKDATCPECGHLLWESEQLARSISQFYSERLGTAPGLVNSETRVSDLGADSLDTVEFVMEICEEFDVRIPDDAAHRMESISDVARYIQEQRSGLNG